VHEIEAEIQRMEPGTPHLLAALNPSKPIGNMALWPHRRLPGVYNRAGAHASDLQVA
jgi:hypothetical protein